MRQVVVIGAGIAGLCAAYEIAQRHPEDQVLVLEGSNHLGGKVRAIQFAGVNYDVGAEMVLAVVPEALDLIAALGLADDLVFPKTTAAWIQFDGRRHPIPEGTVLGVPTSADVLADGELFSAAAKAQVRDEPDLPGSPLTDDASVGGFLRPRLGDEVVDRLIEPLLGGIYAGRADDLSLRATMPALAAALEVETSVLRAAALARRDPADGPTFATLSGGLASLVPALARASGAEIRLGTMVRAVRRAGSGFFVETGTDADLTVVECDALVLAVPPPNAARLLRLVAPVASWALEEVEMASMAIVALSWPGADQQALPGGSGLLVPPGAGGLVKAVTISSNKWPHLAGSDVLLRASVGRIGDEEDLQRTDEDLLALVGREVAELLGLHGPLLDGVVTRWGGGLPQYAVDHLDLIEAVRAAVAGVPGLAVAGAAFDGVGIPACIRSAYAAVDALDGGVSNGGADVRL